MTKPQPEELANNIGERLNAIGEKGGPWLPQSSFTFKQLLIDCDRLQGDLSGYASLRKALLFALSGDKENAAYWNTNAADNGFVDEAGVNKLSYLLMLGYPHEAYSLFNDAFQHRGNAQVHTFIRLAFAAGWFSKIEEIVQVCQKQNLVHKAIVPMEIAPRCARVLAEQNFSIDMVNAVMAEMAAVLREEKQIWKGVYPNVSLHDEATPYAYVLMRFIIEQDADRAAELSWKLADRLVKNELDKPGLVVSFAPAVALQEQKQPAEA